MKLYSGTVTDFAAKVEDDLLISHMESEFARHLLYRPSASERTSWANSLPVLREDLLEAGLEPAGIILESSLPLTSRRLDAIVLGRQGKNRIGAAVVELKQWDHADVDSVEDRLIRLGNRLLLHPQQQVAQYVWYLRDFHSLVESHQLTIDGSAYLHNADSADTAAISLDQLEDLTEFPMFTTDDRPALQEFLGQRAKGGEGEDVLAEYLSAPFRPSKKLLDHVADEIEGHPMFHLLDEQLVAFEVVRRAIDESITTEGKTVVVVTGGPGTGKSVIAVRVVGEAAGRGLIVSHATGSRSFTETMRKMVGRRAANIFRYFNGFGGADANELDVLVCDEAHRIRGTSVSRFTPRSKRTELPQVDELVQVAKVPIFLLDENQVVRPQEIGTVQIIREAAARNHASVVQVDLNSQFRCMGSEAFVAWVERFLGIHGEDPVAWDQEEAFELRVADSPEELEMWLRAKRSEGFTARMTAGFCWPWSDPMDDGTLINDVVIGTWSRPWNAKPDRKAKDAPRASYWASDPRGFGQVGCIYTAQGFEYDYSGVIIGPDMVWRDGKWETDSSRHADPVTKKARNFDELVRNIYKVLLTRGLRGCAVFSLDRRTQNLLESLIP